MNTEIIIAARGELPENLMRTVKAAAKVAPVCVIFDGTEKGNEVPEGLKDLARVLQGPDIPQGCGQARHQGIITSEASLIVLVDGHMTFPRGWLDVIEKHHLRRTNHLTCCRMKSLDQSAKPMKDKPQGGAFLALKSREVGSEHWALSAKWNKPPAKAGPVPAVMGACYAFRRKWYAAIGEPLELLHAWGGDEEVLSLGTHFMGGHVHLLPVTVGHIYMASHTGRVKTADESAAIWGNRFAIVEALPIPEPERDNLRRWMNKSPRAFRDIPPTPEKAERLYRLWNLGKRSWEDLRSEGIVRELSTQEQKECLGKKPTNDAKRHTPPPAPEGDKAQIVSRPVERCERCDTINPFRQIRGRQRTGAFGIAYARCRHCGHKAQIRIG
tara:strand:+ start:1227 stop:2378 length:1152 start_codon:yes stop_codon:yes gene_type:complete